MPVTTGSLITAAFYNALQSAIATILGTGVGGYGQTVTSSQVTNLVLDQATHWNKLKTDIQSCRAFQSAAAFTEAQLPTITTAQLIRASDINLYESAVNAVVSGYTGNLMLVTGAFSDSRTTTWSTSIDDSVLIDFGTVANANAFFTNGGEVTMILTQPTIANPHDAAWSAGFNGMGTVSMANAATSRSGSMGIPATTKGWTTLTTTDTIILDGTDLNKSSTAYSYGGGIDDLLIRAKKNATGTGVIITTSIANNKTDTISASTKLSFGYKKRVDMSTPTFAFNGGNTFNT